MQTKHSCPDSSANPGLAPVCHIKKKKYTKSYEKQLILGKGAEPCSSYECRPPHVSPGKPLAFISALEKQRLHEMKDSERLFSKFSFYLVPLLLILN